ncbi:MFS transporter [Thioclava sp. GXIMD2076]|uniref:MFS transporter n=1 Tax=Thioclava sp. GXIMD2076 TaxID=3131931 RepID=UPI0030CC360E
MTHADPAATQTTVYEDGLPVPRRYFALFALLVTLTLVVLDGAIANVALPAIHESLNASTSKTVWVVTAYQLTLVMGLLPMAFLGEAIGPKRLFTGGVILFTLSSGLCALAPSIDWLIAARVLQGIGAAPIMSLTIALLRYSLPAGMLGRVIGFNSMVVALATAAGPALGAAVLSVTGWPWLFALNVPVGIVALVASVALIGPRGTGRRADIPAMVMNALGFAALILGAGRVAVVPWQGWAMLAASVLVFAALIRREWHKETPVIPLDLLRRPAFRLSIIVSVTIFAGQMAGFVALPFLLMRGFSMSPLEMGLAMSAWPLALATTGAWAGRMADRIDGARLCAIGALVMALGFAIASVWSTSLVPLILGMVISGAAFGFVQVPNNRNMLMTAPRVRAGAAGGCQSTARLLGQTVGGLALSIMFALLPEGEVPQLGLAFAAIAAIAGGLMSLRRSAVARSVIAG